MSINLILVKVFPFIDESIPPELCITITAQKPDIVREGFKKNINYFHGIFHGRGGGGTPHPSK